MEYKAQYIKYLNSTVNSPAYFVSIEDMIEYCNITCIIAFDFLDIELTTKICTKKWNDYQIKEMEEHPNYYY